jgi:hypothetical protein
MGIRKTPLRTFPSGGRYSGIVRIPRSDSTVPCADIDELRSERSHSRNRRSVEGGATQAEREDTAVLLQRYLQAQELHMSYLNRFFVIRTGHSPSRSGETLTDDAMTELARLYAEEQSAHQAWLQSVLDQG